jgi:hypothetical protein
LPSRQGGRQESTSIPDAHGYDIQDMLRLFPAPKPSSPARQLAECRKPDCEAGLEEESPTHPMATQILLVNLILRKLPLDNDCRKNPASPSVNVFSEMIRRRNAYQGKSRSVRVMPPNPPVKGYRCPFEIMCSYMALLPDGGTLLRALSLPSAKLCLRSRRSR